MNSKKTILVVFAAAIALAGAGRAGGVDDEIKALQRVINSNSVDRTVDCRWYRAWYIDQCTKEEREAILERNIAAHRRWIELLGGSGTPRAAQAQASLGKEIAMNFKCDLFPPERPPKLFVVGKSSDHRVFPAIEIVVNGRVVWSGEAFASRYFKPLEIELPVDALKHSNRLVLRNTAPSTQSQRMPEIHYAVIRR